MAKARGKALLLCIFYTPLTILVLEHIVGTFYCSEILSRSQTQAVAAVRGNHENKLIRSSHYSLTLSLSEIAGEKKLRCPDSLVRVGDIDNPASHSTKSRRIPQIVHQTAKTRCLTPAMEKATRQWHFDGWSYYFHDDEAIFRLFQREFADFPQLEMVVRKCLIHGTIKADLWRYIVLWVYGGVYSDLDAVPAKFTPDTIQFSDDAFFVVEQFHALSQYFIAVSPRHPLMWYAIQHSIINLLRIPDTGSVPASLVTGPHALHAAFVSFRKDAGFQVDPLGTGYKPVWAGRFAGTYNRTVTVVGVGENQNEYIQRDALGMHVKKASYKKMGMRHFQDDKKYASEQSCLSAILRLSVDEKSFHSTKYILLY